MEKIASKDGTPIACWRTGEGSPLVLVHGGISDHSYEPPVNAATPPGFVERLESMLEAEDNEGVILTFVRELLGLEPEEVPERREWVPKRDPEVGPFGL